MLLWRRHRGTEGTRTYLIISQVYVPDPTSVGQHLADAAVGLVRRGYRVKVLTSRRGYDDPSQIYLGRETIDGVTVRRLGLSSFGKGHLVLRLVGQIMFVIQAFVVGLFTRDLHAILISTSPPIAGFAGFSLSLLRRVPLRFWAMDLNPDQAIAMGVVGPRSWKARALEGLNRLVLERSDVVVTLDEFMGARLQRKTDIRDKLVILPPWPHNSQTDLLAPDDTIFRRNHELRGRFVVMYSGNHSPAHPLDTLIDAARELSDDDRFCFVFVGGGLAKAKVERLAGSAEGRNLVALPYQPISSLSDSLGAADVHAVTMGDNMVGCVHPTKVYGALAAGRPILYVGPLHSHIGRLITKYSVGWQFEHRQHRELADKLQLLVESSWDELREMGERGARLMAEELSRPRLENRFLDAIDTTEPQGP